MPQFFFDIESEAKIIERVSADLPDLDTAKQYAAKLADTLMRGDMKPWVVTVRDENDETSATAKPEIEKE